MLSEEENEAVDRLRAMVRSYTDNYHAMANVTALLNANSVNTVLTALEAANARADEYEQLFEMRRQAERRGIEMWRSEKPGRELREPDSANFTMWLLNRIEFDETVFAELRERAERAEAALQHAKKGLLSVHECGSGGCSECPRVADECLGEVEMIEAQTND